MVLKNMLFSGNFSWVFPLSFVVHVFSFLLRYFIRFSGENSMAKESILDDLRSIPEENSVENEVENKGCDQIEDTVEIPKFEFELQSVCNASSTSKYQFFTGNSVCAFIEEPPTINLTIQEIFVLSHDESHPIQDPLEKDDSFPEIDFSGFSVIMEDQSSSHDLGSESSSSLEKNDCDELSEEVLKQGKLEYSVLCLGYEKQESFEKEESIDQKDTLVEKIELCDEVQIFEKEEDNNMENIEFYGKNHSSISNSDDFWASIHKYDGLLLGNNEINSDFDEILYDKSSAEALGDDIRVDYHDKDSPRSIDDFVIDENNSQLEGVESPYIELEIESYSSTKFDVEKHLIMEVFSDDEEELKELDGSENGEVEDDMLGSDVLMEQKELIRQMKKEMRQLKISGLPTILEESESPRVEEDLRPLRIDERIGHKDRMDEIQTFYRRYFDKMRKLDILSQQTMYAIGLLQLKNQDLALNKKVSSVPVIKSLLAQNFWSNKLKKHEADPVQKLIRDLQRDLELSYVGQLCLSWEMLKWQHHKAEELRAHDPDGFRQHNQVAGEFQKFQVLLQRFTENEPFHQGPRVQHYVKSRCSLPSLLQVPLIKDDPKSEWRRNGEDGISVRMLKEVIAASIRSFWEFLRADKDEVCAISLMGIHGVQIILQDPSDTDLLTEIRSSLQKKEKRLKDLVRSGNCLVKKFQKHQDERVSHEMLVAQVELRLVSRVLSMPKLTSDQLLWCHKKLNKIDIIGRKIYLEHSFLLFPC